MADALERLERGPLVSRARSDESVAGGRAVGVWERGSSVPLRPLAPTRVGWRPLGAITVDNAASSEALGDLGPREPRAVTEASPTIVVAQRDATPGDRGRELGRSELGVGLAGAVQAAALPLQPSAVGSVRVEPMVGPTPVRLDPRPPTSGESETIVRERELIHERVIERRERVIERQERIELRPSASAAVSGSPLQPRLSAPASGSVRVATPPLRSSPEPMRVIERVEAALPIATPPLRSRETVAPIIAASIEPERRPPSPSFAPAPSNARPMASSDSSAPTVIAPPPSRTHGEADRQSADVQPHEVAPRRVSPAVEAPSPRVAPEPARSSGAGLRSPTPELGAIAAPPARPTVTIEIGRIELITTPSKSPAPAPSPARSVARGFSIDAGGSYRGLGGRGGR